MAGGNADKTNVAEWITTCFLETARTSGLHKDNVNLDADLFKEYGLKSVNALRLISDIEVEFDIDIKDEEAKSIKTLNDMIGLIRTKTNSN